MVGVDEAVVARFEHSGKSFEVLIDSKLPELIRDGAEFVLDDYVAVEMIFSKFRRPKAKDGAGIMGADATDSERATDEDMMTVFGSTDFETVVKAIIERGDIQLTTTQRREMMVKKRAQIVNHIAEMAINPQTGSPHPPDRIDSAISEAKVNIDAFLPVDQQIQKVTDALRPLLPISFENVRIAIRLPGDAYGRCYQTLKGLGKLEKEEWAGDGAWIGVLELPAGMQGRLYDELNKKVRGEFDTKKL